MKLGKRLFSDNYARWTWDVLRREHEEGERAVAWFLANELPAQNRKKPPAAEDGGETKSQFRTR